MIELPHLRIHLHRDHAASPGAVYVAACADGALVVTMMEHRDRDRFVAELHTTDDADIIYKVRASNLTDLEARLIKATRSEAGMDALTTLSIGQSMGRKVA
jgi:hypothetical protein